MAAFRIETDPPSIETLEVARKELRETPERIKESTEQLRLLLEADTSLYYSYEEDYLKMFLRPTKYYPESAYHLLQRIADFREKQGSLVKNLTPTSIKNALMTTKVVNVLADRDQNGRRVLILNIGGCWNPDEFSTDDIFCLSYLIHLAAMMEPETQIRGCVIIMDMRGMSYKQATSLTPNFAYKLITFIQDAMALRLKEVHIVNQPFLFSVVWSIFKKFMRNKLKSRVYIHGNSTKTLHEKMDPRHLPKDYGGLKPKIDYSLADWYPAVVAFEDKIMEWNRYGKVHKNC